jgi:hypothetical protein
VVSSVWSPDPATLTRNVPPVVVRATATAETPVSEATVPCAPVTVALSVPRYRPAPWYPLTRTVNEWTRPPAAALLISAT